MKRNKNKILNKKTLLTLVLLGIFVLTNFTSAVEVTFAPNELRQLNESERNGDTYEKKHPNCDVKFAEKLQKLDSDSSWDYAWLNLGSKDNTLTSRWNYSNPVLAQRSCLIYEKIDIAPTLADMAKWVFTGVDIRNLNAEQKKYLEEKIGGTTPITKIEWDHMGPLGAPRPVGLARTDYAIEVEQKLLNTTISITDENFNEIIGQKDGQASTVSRIVGWIVNSLINTITSVISIVIAWIGNLLAITIERSILISWYPGIVMVGWTIVRDIMNMIFIIAMIAMALGTILRIEKYNYKNLLVKVVLMALLINFSYVIAISLIDFSNMFAKFFYADSQWHSLTFIWQNVAWGGGIDGGVSTIANSISGLILSIVMLVAFLTLTGMFIIRTVGLWMLIILSPAAFGLNILPATEEYAHKWWSTFSKYLIWAPVALFFLHLAEALLDQLNEINQDQSSVFNKVIVMAFIWGAVYVAQQAGMVGGDMVLNTAKKIGFGGAQWAGKRGLGFAGRYYNEWTASLLEGHEGKKPGLGKKTLFAILNPVAVARGWEKRSHELAEMHKHLAEAGGREVAEQFLTTDIFKMENLYAPWRLGKNIKSAIKTGGKLKIPYRQFVERAEENEFLKDYQNMRKETLMSAAVEADSMTGHEGEVRKMAIVKAAAAQGYLDDLLRMKHFANQYADKDGTVYSAEVLNRFLYGYLGHGEQAMRFMAEDMEDLGKQVKHYEYIGHATFDPNSQTFKNGMQSIGDAEGIGGKVIKGGKLKNTDQASYAAGELAKVGGRQRAEIAPHNIVPIRAMLDENGDFLDKGEELSDNITFGRANGEIDEFSSAILKTVGDAATLRDIHFAQSRTKNWILSGDVDQNTGEIMVNSQQEYEKIKELWKQAPDYVKAMYEQHTGIERSSVKGLRVAWYIKNKDEVTDKKVEIIDDPVSVPLPVAKPIAEEILSHPEFQLSKKDRDDLVDKIRSEITDAVLGNAKEEDIKQRITVKLAGKGIDIGVFMDDLYKKIEKTIELRHNPSTAIAEIDKRLGREKKPKMSITQINAIAHAVSVAVGKAHAEAGKAGIRIGTKEGLEEIRKAILEQITSIPKNANIPEITESDIEYLAQHARPMLAK